MCFQTFDDACKAGVARRILTARWLVENHHGWVHHDDGTDCAEFLLGGRQVEWVHVELFGEAYQLGDAVHAMRDVLIAHADLARTEFEFLADAFQKQLIVGILKDIAHAARPFGGAALIDVNAINQHFASGGAQNAVEMLDQRGLPCTVLPYDRHRLVAVKCQVHSVKGLVPSGIGVLQCLQLDFHESASLAMRMAGSSVMAIGPPSARVIFT